MNLPCINRSYSPQELTTSTSRFRNFPSSTPSPAFLFLTDSGTNKLSHTLWRLVPESLIPTVACLTIASSRIELLLLMNWSELRQDLMSHPVTSDSVLSERESAFRPSISQMNFSRLTRTATGGLLKRTMRAKGRSGRRAEE